MDLTLTGKGETNYRKKWTRLWQVRGKLITARNGLDCDRKRESNYSKKWTRLWQVRGKLIIARNGPVALFTKILTIKNCCKCKTKIKKSFTKIFTIILSVKIVLTLRVKLPCRICKILNVREIFVWSFIVSEKKKKDGRCIGASVWK